MSGLQDDFLAAKSAASRPDDSWLRALADQPAKTTPASSNVPATDQGKPAQQAPAAAPPADPNVPFGTRVLNALEHKPGWTYSNMVPAATDPEGHTHLALPEILREPILSALKSGQKLEQGQIPQVEDYMPAVMAAIGTAIKAPKGRIGSVAPAAGAAADAGGEGAAAAKPGLLPKVGEDGLPPEGWSNTNDPTTGEPWDPSMPKSARIARVQRAFPGLQQVPFDEVPVPPERDYMFAGQNPDAAGRFRIGEADRAKAADFLNGKTPDNPLQASIETLSDKAAAGEIISKVAKFIPEGSVKHDDVLLMGAYSVQRTPSEIASGIMKALPTDEETGAWMMAMDSGAQQVKGFADAYAADPTPENFEKAARAFTLQLKMQKEWDTVGSEEGRAFRARQQAELFVNADRKDFRDNFKAVVEQLGGDNVEEAIRKIASLDDPKKVNPFLSLMRRMMGRDALVYGWQNMLLSNPRSVLKELTSDVFTSSWEVAVRAGAARLGDGVAAGEASQMGYGYVTSIMDGVRMAGRALKTGESQFDADYQTIEGNTRSRMAELAKKMQKEGETETPESAAVRYLSVALPVRWQLAADDFHKYIHYRAFLRGGAYREVVAGKAPSVDYLMNTPTEGLHEEALANSRRASFTDELAPSAQKMADLVDGLNVNVGGVLDIPAGRIVMPFMKVPANLTRYAYRNSPLYAVSGDFRRDLEAGGARRSLSLARVGLGSAVATAVATLAASDQITGYGPHDQGLRTFWLQTHQPYSARVGKEWVSYLPTGPAAMIVGPVADTVDVMRFAVDRDAEDMAWSAAFGVGQAMLAPTYMMGMANFFDALLNPEQSAANFGENLVTSMVVPQAVWGLERGTDPWRRMHYDLLDNIDARTPGRSTALPQQVNIWGDPVRWPEGVPAFVQNDAVKGIARTLSPLMFSPADQAQPIDKWIYENRLAFPRGDEGRLGVNPPGRVQTFSAGGLSTQIELNVMQLHDLRVLAGNGVKDPVTKLGAKDFFNALVQGKNPNTTQQRQWDKASPEARAVMVQRIWGRFREAAKRALIAEDGPHPELRAQIEGGLQQRKDALKAPAAAAPAGGAVQQPQF